MSRKLATTSLPPLVIRALLPEDVGAMARNCFPEDKPEEVAARLQDELSAQVSRRGLTLVAEAAGNVVATLSLQIHGNCGWVYNVAVHPVFRGRGIVGHLLSHLIEECHNRRVTRLALHVRRGNSAAIRAYERAGFRFTGEDGMRGEQLRYEKVLTTIAS